MALRLQNRQPQIAALEREMSKQKQQLGEILLGRASAYYAKKALDEAREKYLELANRFRELMPSAAELAGQH